MAKKKAGKGSRGKRKESFVNADSSINSQVKDDYEVFEVEGRGEEKNVIQPLKQETEEPVSKEQVKRENKILKTAVLIMIGAVLLFAVFYLVMYFSKNIEYKGVRFELDSTAMVGRTLYKTSVPVLLNGEEKEYRFWLRNDPRSLNKIVPVRGEIDFRKNMVLNLTTEDLFCDGDWNLALANILKLDVFGVKVLAWNESEEYTPRKDYMFITISEGNSTEIKRIEGYDLEVGLSNVERADYNYEMNIADCEVLPAAERLLLEAFVEYNAIAKAN